MRPAYRAFVATGLALALGPGATAAPGEPARPNILFVAVDDLRPEFGAYGHAHVKSPNLDRLAARGMVFRRAYCQQAVCSPSRSSLLTGCRPDTTKVWDLETHFRKALPDVVTLPQWFKQNGYFVRGMGKIFHGGFDDPPSWSVPWSGAKTQVYALPENLELVRQGRRAAAEAGKTGKALQRSGRGPAFEAADVPDETFADGKVAVMAIEALRQIKAKEQPFFLAVGFARPHLPFVAPKTYWDLYDPEAIDLAPNPFRPRGAPDYALTGGGELRSYHGIPGGHIPDNLARHLKHGYYAAISYMDAQLGKVLDELDRLGLRENTIVVLWGDHGWKLGEHDAWCKHSNVELDTNAPLLVASPGMRAAGRSTEALVEFVDIYPTLAELAGLPLPEHLEGTSFAPVLNDPTRPWKVAAFSQYPRAADGKRLMGYSMRTDRYRLTRWVERDDPSRPLAIELYDHQIDPREDRNVADDPTNAELIERLSRRAIAGWREARPARP